MDGLLVERGFLYMPEGTRFREMSRIRNMTYLECLEMFGYDALLPDTEDIGYGTERLNEYCSENKIPVVATNLIQLPAEGGIVKSLTIESNGKAYLILNLVTPPDRKSLAKMGIASPAVSDDIANAAIAEINANTGFFDKAIVFADLALPELEIRRLIEDPRVLALMICLNENTGVERAKAKFDDVALDKICIVPSSYGGKFVYGVSNNPSAPGTETFEVAKQEVRPELKENKKAAALIASAKKEMGEVFHGEFKEWQKGNTDVKWVGSIVCFDCHLEQAENWRGTSHSTAFAALEAKNEASDPECLGCHTVAFGAGGYEYERMNASLLTTGRFKGVGCESCHGPGYEHVKFQRSKEKTSIAPDKEWVPIPGSDVCTGCHTGGHDTDFDFDKMLPLVNCRPEGSAPITTSSREVQHG